MKKEEQKETSATVAEVNTTNKFKQPLYIKTSIEMPEGTLLEAEPFENMIDRMMFERTPLTDTSVPLIYNAEGQENPEWDIRTDHWEIAQDQAEAQLKKRKDFIESMKKGKEEKAEEEAPSTPKTETKSGETAS